MHWTTVSTINVSSSSLEKIVDQLRDGSIDTNAYLLAMLDHERLEDFWSIKNLGSTLPVARPADSTGFEVNPAPGMIASSQHDYLALSPKTLIDWLRFVEQSDEMLQSLSQEY